METNNLGVKLTEQEMMDFETGEAITLTAVMAILAIALVAVIVYKLFTSNKGSSTLPGGWKFTWE